MPKIIFIYFSLTKNGDAVADYLKEKGYEIRKVISKYHYPKNRFLQIMIGGYKASLNKKDKLLNFDDNIDEYDEIIIGSPIWNDRLSSPINAVLSMLNIENKKVSFILYSASGKAEHEKKKIKEKYQVEPIILKEPKENKKELEKVGV